MSGTLWHNPQANRHYDPRRHPMPVPSTGIFDSPTVKLCINTQWASHLDGPIARLMWDDAWLGTQDEKDRAFNEINKLLAAMGKISYCDTQIRQNEDNCAVLESSGDGETWVTVADFSDCFVAKHPDSLTRNTVTPTDPTYPAISHRGFTDWRNPITNVQNAIMDTNGILTNMQVLTQYLKAGGIGANQLGIDTLFQDGGAWLRFYTTHRFSGLKFYRTLGSVAQTWEASIPYFDDTRFQIFSPSSGAAAGFTLRDDGKAGFGTDTPTAKQHVKTNSAVERGQIIEINASATANAQEIYRGTSLKAGIDRLGRHFLATSAGAPTDTNAKAGTIVWDSTNKDRAWVKASDAAIADWIAIGSLDLVAGLFEVVVLPNYGTGTAYIEGTTIYIEFPEVSEVGETSRIYHRARPRPDAGQTDSVVLACGAFDRVMLPWEIHDDDVITVSQVTGWLSCQLNSTEIFEGYNGDGTDYFTGNPSPMGDLDYKTTSSGKMAIILAQSMDASPFYKYVDTDDLLAGYMVIDTDASNPRASFLLNTPDISLGLTFYGNVQFKVSLLANTPEFALCGMSDFTTGLHDWAVKDKDQQPYFEVPGFTPDRASGGSYVSGVGFQSTQECFVDGPTPDYCRDMCAVIGYLGAEATFHIKLYYDVVATGSYTIDFALYSRHSGVWGSTATSIPATTGSHTYTTVGAAAVGDAICISLYSHWTNYENGNFTLTGIEVLCEE